MSGAATKTKGMLPSARVEQGPYLLLAEVIVSWCAHTALTIATGYYLWFWENNEENRCMACNVPYSFDNGHISYNTPNCEEVDV